MPRKTVKAEPVKRAIEEVRRLLAARTPEAVAVLVEIMQDEGQKPELRMKAAESILDRACGKATAAGSAGEDAATAPRTVIFEGVLEEWSK